MKDTFTSLWFFQLGIWAGLFLKVLFDALEKYIQAKISHWEIKRTKALIGDLETMKEKLLKDFEENERRKARIEKEFNEQIEILNRVKST